MPIRSVLSNLWDAFVRFTGLRPESPSGSVPLAPVPPIDTYVQVGPILAPEVIISTRPKEVLNETGLWKSPNGNYDLEEIVGLLSAAELFDAKCRALEEAGQPSPGFRLSDYDDVLFEAGGFETLFNALKDHIPIQRIDLTPDIYQTDDPYRGIVEHVSNSLDAKGYAPVQLSFESGTYTATDRGTGMTGRLLRKLLMPKISGKRGEEGASETIPEFIGRFGIGFNTGYRFLQTAQDSIDLVTCSATQPGRAYHLHFGKESDGRLVINSERLNGEGVVGTTVKVKSRMLENTGRVEEQIRTYLRYVPSDKLLVNGESWEEEVVYEHTCPSTPEPEKPFIGYRHQSGVSGRVVVKSGDIELFHRDYPGYGYDGEIIIQLPVKKDVTLTRDKPIMTRQLYEFLKESIISLNSLAEINSFTNAFAVMDEEQVYEPFLVDLLKARAHQLIKANPQWRVYPDSAVMRKAVGDNPNVFWIHENLYDEVCGQGLAIPSEYRYGKSLDAGVSQKPVVVLISPDIQDTHVYDAQAGVFYLSEEVYKTRSSSVLGALFAIEGLDFKINWQTYAAEAAQRVHAPVSVGTARLERGEGFTEERILSLQSFFSSLGLKFEDLSIPLPVTHHLKQVFFWKQKFVIVDIGDWPAMRNNPFFLDGKPVLPSDLFYANVAATSEHIYGLVTTEEAPFIIDEEGTRYTIPAGLKVESFEVHQDRLLLRVTDSNKRQAWIDLQGTLLTPFIGGNNNRLLPMEVYGKTNKFYSFNSGSILNVQRLLRESDPLCFFDSTEQQILKNYHVFGYGQDASGRSLFIVMDSASREGVVDADGSIVVPFEVQEIQAVIPWGDSFCFITRDEPRRSSLKSQDGTLLYQAPVLMGPMGSFIYDGEKQVPLFYFQQSDQGPREFFYFDENHQVVKLPLRNRPRHVYGPLYVAESESEIKTHSDAIILRTKHISVSPGFSFIYENGGKAVFLNFTLLESLAENPRSLARLQEAQGAHLSVGPLLMALVRVPDDLWSTWISDAHKKHMLGQLGHPTKLALVQRFPNLSPNQYAELFKIIDTIGDYSRENGLENFLDKLESLLHSNINLAQAAQDPFSTSANADTHAIKDYLATPGTVFLEEREAPYLAFSIDGDYQNLSDVVAHIKMNLGVSMGQLSHVPRYDNDEARSLVNYGLNLNSKNPHIFVRELLRQSLRGQKKTGDDHHLIDMNLYRHQGSLYFRIKDGIGLSREEFIQLLSPNGSREELGVEFYAALAQADTLRIRTSQKESGTVMEAEFQVYRSQAGGIESIGIKCREVEKTGPLAGFDGTEIDMKYHVPKGTISGLEASRLKAVGKDMAQYVDKDRVTVLYNNEKANQGRSPLVEIEKEPILGKIKLYDGLNRRVLLGGLPLAALPQELWDKIPAGIKEYYVREGFYLDLDPEYVKTVPTGDRFRDNDKVVGRLQEILPALLLRGYLSRILNPYKPEDLHKLPHVYFNNIIYEDMASDAVLGTQVVTDAELFEKGEYEKVNFKHYEDDNELIKLVTCLHFIPLTVEGQNLKLSVRDINHYYHQSEQGGAYAQKVMEAVYQSPLVPEALKDRLRDYQFSKEAVEDLARKLQEDIKHARNDIVDGLAADQLYSYDQIKSESAQRYLGLIQQMTERLYQAAVPGGRVVVGVHTKPTSINSAGYHYLDSPNQTYYFYETYGDKLRSEIKALNVALTNPDKQEGLKQFKAILCRKWELMSHELTHAIKQHPQQLSHGEQFYRDNRQLLLSGTKGVTDALEASWYQELRSQALREEVVEAKSLAGKEIRTQKNQKPLFISQPVLQVSDDNKSDPAIELATQLSEFLGTEVDPSTLQDSQAYSFASEVLDSGVLSEYAANQLAEMGVISKESWGGSRHRETVLPNNKDSFAATPLSVQAPINVSVLR